jgi:medium-chain acyl-[acyl-carrier-protein] hydrolase
MSTVPHLYARPGGHGRLVLFCFPYAGGSALAFRDWAALLPPSVEVAPVELPGRGRLSDLPLHTDMPGLAAYLADQLAPRLEGPFAFFGHSMGAMISFELARLLRRRGQPGPAHMFLSAQRAPHLPLPLPLTYTRSDEELWEEIGRLNGIPREVRDEPGMRELLVPALRADLTVCGTYAYAPDKPLDCSLTVLGGMQDPLASRGQLEEWRGHTTAPFMVQMFPGDHFFLQTAQSPVVRFLGYECAAIAQQLA